MTRTIPSTYRQAATLFLSDLAAPTHADMIAAVAAWLIEENGPGPAITRNNPWNLHSDGGLLGQTGSIYVGPGDTNVAAFDTLAHGCLACANNLLRPWTGGAAEAKSYGYDKVVAAARAADVLGFLNALAASSWSAGRYGTKNGGANVLLAIYRSFEAPAPGKAA